MGWTIPGWDSHEKSENRKIKGRLSWIAMPTKQGRGYCKLVERHGALGLGVWWGIAMQSATNPQDLRGVLVLSVDDLSLVTRIPADELELVIPTLVKIGWLRPDSPDNSDPLTIPQDPIPIPQENLLTGHNRTGQDRTRKKKSPPTPQGPPFPAAKILKLWIDTKAVFKTRWVSHRSLTGKALVQPRARWKEVPDLDLWKLALETCARDAWWAGKKPGNDGKPWVAALGNFVLEKHFHKWLTVAKETDWRYAGDQDAAWEIWVEQIHDGSIEAVDIGWEGDWPTDQSLTIRQSDKATADIRAWWVKTIFEKESLNG